MDELHAPLNTINSFIWGPFLLIPLLLLTGLYLTIRLGGPQFRVLGYALWLALVRRKEGGAARGDVSHYQALATAMPATIGVGNNESGLGTGAIAAASAITDKPVRQAMVSMTQTFIDTLIMVTLTALAIIATGAWMQEGLAGAPMTAWALEQAMGGGWGNVTVALGVLVFAFTTILGWCYYGERCIERLFGRGGVLPYRLVFSVFIYFGAVLSLDLVWTFSDIANGLMALPNLIGLLLLSGVVVKETRAYFANQDWRDAR